MSSPSSSRLAWAERRSRLIAASTSFVVSGSLILALFAEADGIEACFTEEADGMLEVTPEPNLIIPFDPTHTVTVRDAFHVFGVACETIAAAGRLIDLMPGNDKWVI